jgi:serine protease AprX
VRLRRTATALVTGPLAAALLLAAAPAGAAPQAGPDGRSTRAVVVQAQAGAQAAAEAVAAVGGTVTADLPLVDGVAARVPADRVDALSRRPGVRAVTPDVPVELRSATTSDTAVPSDINHVLLREIGADVLHGRGFTGEGVGVALIDTGVSPVRDLAGRIEPVQDPHDAHGERAQVACVDLSGERSCDDSYGHGTFMAGLVAGDGAASAGRFSGVAPKAHVVSVKIAGRDGSADVSKVLAALQWVVSFKDDHDIRVVNLSLGTNSTARPEVDPLNLAVQRAWRSGLVVVVAASNRGPAHGTISKPADDPLVITVGAVDDRQTPATSDDRVPSFSGRGPTAHGLAKPDVVAPGGRVVGLRVEGSTVDRLSPKGIVSKSYRRGSGTSMSAAVVSGLTALLLDAHPEWSPDRVKHALAAGAVKVGARDPLLVGAGLVSGPGALDAPAGLANSAVELVARGGGDLDDSRADVRVSEACPLTGMRCAREGQTNANGTLHDPSGLSGTWDGQSWYESQWVTPLGQSWYASEWLGQSWYGQSWYGSSWYGTQESATDYGNGEIVPGSAWYGASG